MLAEEAVYRRLEYAGDLSGRPVDAVEFAQCRFHKATLRDVRMTGTSLTDCLLLNVDLANLRAQKSSMRRVRFDDCRATGLQWIDGLLRDVLMTGCRADLTSFRFTDLRNVEFDRCNLSRADFEHADVSGVRFTDCDLTLAQFSNATMTDTRFTRCNLEGVGGVTSFTGAIMTDQDLLLLSRTLAAALGIRIEDPPD